MFIIRSGGTRLVAVADFAGTTGICVDTTEKAGQLHASLHATAGTAISGFAYQDPVTKTRSYLLLGRVGQKIDSFVIGEYVVVVKGVGTGLTNQLADGDYSHGDTLTPSVTTGLLKVASGADVVCGTVIHGQTMATQNNSVEFEFNF